MTQPSASQPVQTQVAAAPRIAAGAGLGMGRVGQAPAPTPAPTKPGLARKLAIAAIVVAVGAAVVIKGLTDPVSAPAPVTQVQVQAETQAVATTGWQPAVPAGAWREESRANDPTAPLLGFVATSGDSMVDQQVIAADGASLAQQTALRTGWRILAINQQGSGYAMGLRTGDLLVSYRGTPLSGSSPDVINNYHRSIERALEPVTVVVIRDGATMTLTGPLGYASSHGSLHP